MFLGGLAWIRSQQHLDLLLAPWPIGQVQPLQVEVVSLDWKWLFIYPDQGVASVNELVVPAGAPLHLRLTSGSVMTAFFVPQLGSLIYTGDGRAVSPLNLRADHPGSYPGLASHFSGEPYFSGMHFQTRGRRRRLFAAWVAAARAGRANVWSGFGYDGARARQSLHRQQPFTYRAAAPGLFEQIATQQLPPGPGPQGGGSSPTAVSGKTP